MSATVPKNNPTGSSAPIFAETPPAHYWERWDPNSPNYRPPQAAPTAVSPESVISKPKGVSPFAAPTEDNSGVLKNNADLIDFPQLSELPGDDVHEEVETLADSQDSFDFDLLLNKKLAALLPEESDSKKSPPAQVAPPVPAAAAVEDAPPPAPAHSHPPAQVVSSAPPAATVAPSTPATPSVSTATANPPAPSPVASAPTSVSPPAEATPSDNTVAPSPASPVGAVSTASVSPPPEDPDTAHISITQAVPPSTPPAFIQHPQSQQPPAPTPPAEDQPPRVLIVEDDRAQALFAQSMLLGAGIQSEVQMDAAKTIESIRRYAPDLVLMDLHMPGIDGMNLTALIRQEPGYQFLPIILLTGDQNPELPITALDTGVDDFLNKPIRPRHLIATVSSRIKRARRQQTSQSPAPTPATASVPSAATPPAPEPSQQPSTSPANVNPTPAKPGITTRSHLLQMIDDSLKRRYSGALFFIELANASSLREQYGYAAFERLISDVGQQIATAIAPHSLARMGDNGFLTLVNNVQNMDLHAYAQELNQRVAARQYRIRGNTSVALNSVIGYSNLDQGFVDAGSALEATERCTLQARQSPDGVAGYLPSQLNQEEQNETKLLLEGDLELAYQPIIASNRNGPLQPAYQVLLRIRKPDGSWLPAGNVIPAAEASGRIADFDKNVIERAIAAISGFGNVPVPLRLFISQSPRTLARDSYADWLLQQISSSGIDNKSLVIDLRLEDALTNTVTVGNFCRRLTTIGVQFCLNQFEPSYEANSLLRWLPLSYIRLASKFANLHNDPPLVEQLRELIVLAHKQGLQVIGQQVENRQAAEAMWQTGVDFIQGNLFHSVGTELDFDFQKGIS